MWTRKIYQKGSIVEHEGYAYIAKWLTDDTDSPVSYENDEDYGLSWERKEEDPIPVQVIQPTKHICLSRCLRVCIMKKPVNCRCNEQLIRRKSTKDNHNFGRYFHSCYVCDFFKWEKD